MKKYVTKQRKALLSFLEKHPNCQFSVEEIADKLCAEENISASSIYRNINDMVEEGFVARFPAKDGRHFFYQYIGGDTCKSHIHMKCESCGQLLHLDDETMLGILASIKQVEGFNIDPQKTILYGSCEKCD